MLYPHIEVIGTGEGFPLLESVYSLRNQIAENLAILLPEPQASLAQGIILGMRGTIPSALKDSFSQTGTAHLLAISGLHLSIIAGILLSVGIWLFGKRRYIYVWLALGIIWLYVLLTGMHPPVIRGAIMASVFLITELLGRQRSAITALAFAAAVMVGISPQILWDASFQLSFLAMVGLIFIAPYLQNLGQRAVNALFGGRAGTSVAIIITDSFAVTLGAVLAIWPVVSYYFGIISFVGPLATFLSLPVLPVIVVTGALAGGLGLIALPVAQVVGWISWLFLSYLLVVVNGFAAIPLSYLKVDTVPSVVIPVYYSVLGIIIWLGSKGRLYGTMTQAFDRLKSGADTSIGIISRSPGKLVIPPMVIAMVMIWTVATTMPDEKLHVSILDVGQGDAILIQQGSQQVLIDGGPSPQKISQELGKKMPFGDRTIELVVSTHPSADHVTGLVEVLHRYEVEEVVYPDIDFGSDIYKEWLELIEEKDVDCTIAQNGQLIDLGGGVIMEVLNPQQSPLTGTESDVDNNGVVLRLRMGEVKFLFTADIMYQAEFELIYHRANLESTVLKVGHHGSNTSTTSEFLAVVDPELAVITVGADNTYGHPTEEVVGRLSEKVGMENIYRTDEDGTIEFITDGVGLWVKVEK